MYNWRLLLAVVAIFQPIASFTERNLVDGRQQCCDHRFERDSSYSLHGNVKLPSEDRRVTSQQRRETREVRRDDRRFEVSALSRFAIDSLRDSKGRESQRSLDLEQRSSRIETQWINRNALASDRARTGRETLNGRRTDRIRIESDRRNLSRDSRVVQINREPAFRAKRDVAETVTRAIEQRSSNTDREARYMRTFNDETRERRVTRDERVESRRTRDTERNLQTVQNVEGHERRVSESSFERKQRNVRSSDRLSSKRLSLERERIVDEERNARTQSRDFRNENERRSIEMKVRNIEESDRKMPSGSSVTPHRLENIGERKSINRSVRRNNEYRVTANYGERAYEIEELRNNVRNGRTYLSERPIVREGISYERRNIVLRAFNDNTRARRDERLLSATRRAVSQVRNIREENQDQSRDIRSASVEERRGNELQRLSRSDSRITESNRINRVLVSRQEEGEYRRTNSERLTRYARDSREQSREITDDRRDTRLADSRQSHVRYNVVQQRRETTQFQERISEERPARDNQRRLDVNRSYRSQEAARQRTMNERQFRERASSDSRLSLKENVQEIERRETRSPERIETRNADQRQAFRAVSMQRLESRTRTDTDSVRIQNERQLRERATSESNRLSRRTYNRETSRDTERRSTPREASRDVSVRQIESRTRSNIDFARNLVAQRNEKQFQERVTFESSSLSPRMNDRELSRDTERRETRTVDRTREASRAILMQRLESRTRTDMASARVQNERQLQERATSESNRMSGRTNDREMSRNFDRTREASRDVSMQRLLSRTRTDMDSARIENERQLQERATSESNRLSRRTNDREMSRDVYRTREASRDVSMQRRFSRAGTDMDSARIQNERQLRERATSESSRLSRRMNDREICSDTERRATLRADRTREESRDVSERRIESRTRSEIDSARNLMTTRQFPERATSHSSRLSRRNNDREMTRATERRETRNSDLTREVARDISMRRIESRIQNEGQLRERVSFVSSRLTRRSNDREMSRDIDRTRDSTRDNISVRGIESRTRINMDSARNHVATFGQKVETENQAYELNWQYLIYTLQGIYLCSVLVPMLLAKNRNKKSMHFGWWTPTQAVIKMD